MFPIGSHASSPLSLTEPSKKWTWEKCYGVTFACSLIVALGALGICYATCGYHLSSMVQAGSVAFAATQVLGCALAYYHIHSHPKALIVPLPRVPMAVAVTPLKVKAPANKEDESLPFISEFLKCLKKGSDYKWEGMRQGELMPGLFAGEALPEGVKADVEVRLKVFHSNEFLSPAVNGTWEGSILYYNLASDKDAEDPFMVGQRELLASYVATQLQQKKTVLLTGIYNKKNEKLPIAVMREASPFVDVGILIMDLLRTWSEDQNIEDRVERDELLCYLKEKFGASYASKIMVYTGDTQATLPRKSHIDRFVPHEE